MSKEKLMDDMDKAIKKLADVIEGFMLEGADEDEGEWDPDQMASAILAAGYRLPPELKVLSDEEADIILEKGINFNHKPSSIAEVHRTIQRDADQQQISIA